MDVLKKLIHTLFEKELEIQHKLLNLILFAALVGGSLALIVSYAVGIRGSYLILLLLAVVVLSLWISNVKKNTQVSAVLITATANMVFFPVMYFSMGGLHSGMPIWMVLGLIFSWLLLKGKMCYIMYALNFLVVSVCLITELLKPELVHKLETEAVIAVDCGQSILVVTLIFGAIFKYQSYVYEKQRESLIEQEEELRRTLEELKKANQAKSAFLANMSHEIRTPINAMLGMDEVILRECQNEEIEKYALNIQTAGQTLLSLVNDILDFSKIESGMMEILPVKYELANLINDSYSMIIMRANEKNLTVKLENNPELPSVLYGDEIRIRQILTNLLTNAVKYTHKGAITLSADWKKTGEDTMLLKLCVIDTGMGMTQENQQKLFRSFQRIDEKRNRSIEGTGLGLAITRQLAEQMGGNVWVESEYGKGSAFHVEIPQRILDEKPVGVLADNQVTQENRNKSYKVSFYAPEAEILVVDDVAMNVEVIKALLKKTGVRLDLAAGGEESLMLAKEKKYHIIFMDHMMPEMDGIEALHKIKAMENGRNQDTPIIALTANAIVGARDEYLAEGFADYLSKPVRGMEIEKIIRKYLPAELMQTGKPRELEVKEESEQGTELLNKTSEKKSFLEKLSFLDTATGLAYCCDSEDFYREMLSTYAGSSRHEDLKALYEKQDWENYTIQVHALKSTSLSIGAAELSEEAKKLEHAAKGSDTDYIYAHHEEMMLHYEKLLGKLSDVLNGL